MAIATEAITVRNLSKTYATRDGAVAALERATFGVGEGEFVAVVAFFPLLVNTMVGLKSPDEDRVSLMRSLAATDRQIFWMLRLPNALPFVMAGLDVAMIFALIGAIVAEFVGAQRGLGTLIQSMNFNMDVSGQFSILLILSFVGLLLNRGIMLIRKGIMFWDPSEKRVLETSPEEAAPAAAERGVVAPAKQALR